MILAQHYTKHMWFVSVDDHTDAGYRELPVLTIQLADYADPGRVELTKFRRQSSCPQSGVVKSEFNVIDGK